MRSEPPARRFAFVEAALDRADALRDHTETLRGYWTNARVLLIDDDGTTLVDAQNQLLTMRGGELADDHQHSVFLGLRSDEAWFAVSSKQAAVALNGQSSASTDAVTSRVDLRSAAKLWAAFEVTAFAQARAILHWQSRHRHCGTCGAGLQYLRGGWLGRCAGCGAEHYPRTDPAVIVAVTDGERLLLGRQSGWPERRYSTLAGFVEPGETLEQTVAREVMEEAGVRVRESRYLASQPWPFPSSLMLGFIATAEPDPPQANEELEDAQWFEREQVGAALRGETHEQGLLLSPRLSISRWLIECWYAQASAD